MIRKALKNFAGGRGSLRRKTISGSNWLAAKSIITGATELVRAAVFARILFPSDYGLMALATIAIGFLESFSATGIEFIIMREEDDYRRRLDAYWTISFIRGWALALIGLLLAFLLSAFYGKPELIPLICMLSAGFIIRGTTGFGREIRQREMAFKRVTIVESSSAGIELAIGLIALVLLRNVWALATYMLIHSIATVICSYVLFPWKPRFSIEMPIVKKIIAFSGSVIIINLLNYFFVSFDIGTVGKLLGTEQAGFYARANFLALLPATYLANIVAPVFLASFRRIGGDQVRLQRAFAKTIMVFSAFFLAMALSLAFLSKPIISLVYGQRWLPVVPVFRILLIFGASKGVTAIVPMVFFLRNKPWILTICTSVMALCFSFLCVPLTRWGGISGTAWAVVISSIGSHLLSIFLAFRMLKPQTSTIAEPVTA